MPSSNLKMENNSNQNSSSWVSLIPIIFFFQMQLFETKVYCNLEQKWYPYLQIQSLKTESREGKQEVKITEAKYRLFFCFFDNKGYQHLHKNMWSMLNSVVLVFILINSDRGIPRTTRFAWAKVHKSMKTWNSWNSYNL